MRRVKPKQKRYWNIVGGKQQQERFTTVRSRQKADAVIFRASKQRELQARPGQRWSDSANSPNEQGRKDRNKQSGLIFFPLLWALDSASVGQSQPKARWQRNLVFHEGQPPGISSRIEKIGEGDWREKWNITQRADEFDQKDIMGLEDSLWRAGGNGGNVYFPSTHSCFKLALTLIPTVHPTQVARGAKAETW